MFLLKNECLVKARETNDLYYKKYTQRGTHTYHIKTKSPFITFRKWNISKHLKKQVNIKM